MKKILAIILHSSFFILHSAMAAELGSSDIDEFFSLPSWLPSSASSFNTPGSDPAAGGGWYATNGLPRAARMSEALYAGLLSSFAGYFERQYHALQGQTNSWSSALYGPTSGGPAFWFDSARDTNRLDYFEFDWSVATNRPSREIATRRLAHYGPVCRLCDFLRKHYVDDDLHSFGYHFRKLGVSRPGWIYPGDLVWSSTREDILGEDRIVPSMTSVRDFIRPYTNYWQTCCCSFVNLVSNRAPWEASGSPYVLDDSGLLTRRLAENVYVPGSCGDTDPTPYGEPEEIVGRRIPAGMHDVLTNAYPHADPDAITNATRRTVLDSLACANQVLGLMDRTFHLPALGSGGTVTNRNFTHAYTVSGTVGVSATYDPDSGGFTFASTAPVRTGAHETITESGESLDATGNALHFRIGPTASATTSSAGGADETVRLTVADVWTLLDQMYDPNAHTNVCFCYPTFTFDPENLCVTAAYCWQSDSGLSSSERVYLTKYFTGMFTNVVATTRAQRSCRYGRTLGYALGPTQPGRDAGSRAADCRCGLLTSLHTRPSSIGWSDMSYDDIESDVEYSSEEFDYASRPGLVAILDDAVDDLESAVIADYGMNPTNVTQVLPIDPAVVVRAFGTLGVSGGNVAVNGSLPQSSDVNVVVNEYDWPQSWSFEILDPQTGYHAFSDVFCTLSASLTATNAPVAFDEREALSADARLGILTRTDWAWLNLHRTDN